MVKRKSLCAIGLVCENFKLVAKPYIFRNDLMSCLDGVGTVHANILDVREPPARGTTGFRFLSYGKGYPFFERPSDKGSFTPSRAADNTHAYGINTCVFVVGEDVQYT